MSLNRVVLVGRLTRDPEMKYTPQGVAVAQMGIAVDRFTKNDQGEYETDFFNVTAWRRTAEFASNYLTKGRLISVDGRLQTRSWIDQTSGQKRTAFEIVAENIQGLDKRQDGENAAMGNSSAGNYDEPAAAANPGPAPAQARTAAPTAPAPRPASARNAPPAPAYDNDTNEDADPFADE